MGVATSEYVLETIADEVTSHVILRTLLHVVLERALDSVDAHNIIDLLSVNDLTWCAFLVWSLLLFIHANLILIIFILFFFKIIHEIACHTHRFLRSLLRCQKQLRSC